MGSRKVAVSQRWDQETLDIVKEGAQMLNVSQTQFTVEAVHIFFQLIQNPAFREASNERKIQIINEIGKGHIEITTTGQKAPDKKSHAKNDRPPGFIIDLIYNFLRKHSGTMYSTTQIAEILNIPQSTVRAYIRKLSEQDTAIKIYPGRPNKVEYVN